MVNNTWLLRIDGKEHTVRFEHGYWSGKRQIWLDGELLHTSRRLQSQGFRYWFEIGAHRVGVIITTNGFTYRYFLFLDSKPIPSQAQEAKGISQAEIASHPHIARIMLWSEIEGACGLIPWTGFPDMGMRGWLCGFPVTVKSVIDGNRRDGVQIDFAAHGKATEYSILDRLKTHPLYKTTIIGPIAALKPKISEDITGVQMVFPEGLRKQIPAILSERIRRAAEIMSIFAAPFSFPPDTASPEICTPVPALIGGYFSYACPNDLEKVRDGIRKLSDFQRISTNLIPAFFISISVAIIGSIFSLMIGRYADPPNGGLAVMGSSLFTCIAYVNKLRRVNFRTILVGVAVGVITPVLPLICMMVGQIWSETGDFPSLSLFAQFFQWLFTREWTIGELFAISIPSLGILTNQVGSYRQMRSAQKRLATAEIELIPPELF